MSTAFKPLPIPERPNDPSPLELAIYNFEVECAKYHNSKNTTAGLKDLSKEERNKRQAAQQRDWQHLQRRKKAIAMHSKLSSELQAYQADSKLKDPRELLEEKHHPTRKLSRNLHAVGEVKPSPKHAAHHIVMGKGQYSEGRMHDVRLSLHMYGVGINDPRNGVWLAHNTVGSEDWSVAKKEQKPRHWASPDSPIHLTMHGANYENWIVTILGTPFMEERTFMAHLNGIKTKLRSGNYPKHIEEPYDPEWDGRT
ncbi:MULTISPECIES: AHH domain-containing protein [Gammaproteobacteria]|uniref:AHH domain-containing protein n=1 Tax=Gammaproteobacteria TaxID=1236 RepID=UPI003A9188FA